MQEFNSRKGDPGIEARRDALESLRGRRKNEHIPLLVKAMTDESWRIRKTAVDILFDEYPLERYIDSLIGLLYLEDNAGARNSAIEALTRLGRRATDYLVAAFRTTNRDVRKFIIDILGENGDSRALSLMINALKDEDENVRAAAVEHLGKTGEVSVVDALIHILRSGDLWTAYPAAEALGRIGNVKAVPHLISALRIKPLREPVLESLGRIADPSAIPHIAPLLNDPSKNVRARVLRTLEEFYRRGVDARLLIEEIRRGIGAGVMELLLSHARPERPECSAAILFLGLLKDEAAYGPLLDLSREESLTDGVRNALVSIGSSRPQSILKLFETDDPYRMRFLCSVADRILSPLYYDVLETLLSNGDGHVRSSSALSLSKLNDARAVEKLLTLLTDPYEDVQEAAVTALANPAWSLPLDRIKAGLRDKNPVLRRNAALLLGRAGAAGAVDELGFAIEDEDVRVRKAAVEALSAIGTGEAVRHLAHALTDENPGVRISAILSLGLRGEGWVLESLVVLTADQDDSVRIAAVKSLGMLRQRASVKVLKGLLGDSNGFVVATAIEALAAIGGRGPREAIRGMLSSPDEEIRRTAIGSLAGFEGTEEDILPFLKDPDWATRVAAVRALAGRSGRAVINELEQLLDTESDPAVIRAVEEAMGV